MIVVGGGVYTPRGKMIESLSAGGRARIQMFRSSLGRRRGGNCHCRMLIQASVDHVESELDILYESESQR